eukprot:TRINITY_DN1208_c5_g1_i1.p1 TRINITY_DN1208_c5_g1~~TRINITY_DN1208_c5_g1_i1.p1  ORF type:complete len:295 (+),score=102.52 TRINITY_DN1208_c5_g1_i1:105-989(+)
MSQNKDKSLCACVYPAPPPFFALYTSEDAKSFHPPPPPTSGSFLKFNAVQASSNLPNELDAGVPTLYEGTLPTVDYNSELRKLNKASLSQFVGLLKALSNLRFITSADTSGSLSSSSSSSSFSSSSSSSSLSSSSSITTSTSSTTAVVSSASSLHSSHNSSIDLLNTTDQIDSRMQQLSHVFHNMTFLLNSLRSHQARQTLIHLLMKQIEARLQHAAYLDKCCDDVKTFFADHGVTFDSKGDPSLPSSFSSSSSNDSSSSNSSSSSLSSDSCMTNLHSLTSLLDNVVDSSSSPS